MWLLCDQHDFQKNYYKLCIKFCLSIDLLEILKSYLANIISTASMTTETIIDYSNKQTKKSTY